jgi:hypothetical protein
MVNCLEAENYAGKVWITASKPWQLESREWVVMLEGYKGAFALKCLEKVIEGVTDNEVIQFVYTLKEMPIEMCVQEVRSFVRSYNAIETAARNSRRSKPRFVHEMEEADREKGG